MTVEGRKEKSKSREEERRVVIGRERNIGVKYILNNQTVLMGI